VPPEREIWKEHDTSMKRQWDIEELIEHFTLVEEDEALLANKTGATRLGFALLLKCFQLEGKFPTGRHEIPKDVVNSSFRVTSNPLTPMRPPCYHLAVE
jgi:hypothetical protein